MKYTLLLFSLLAFQSLKAQTTPETPAQTTPEQTTPAQTTPSQSTVRSAPASIPAQAAMVDDKKLTLHERFLIMKTKSQSYNDYKVIKETVLDGVWKITRDSMAAKKAELANLNKSIADLKSEVNASKTTLQQKEASMLDVLYDSTHITVLGIPMTKQFFLGAIAIVLAGLVIGLLLVSGRLKQMYTSVKEKSELALAIHSEYEEYKRKALDKQTKLSRELQNERNKLAEIRR
jgi:hypothetical protein